MNERGEGVEPSRAVAESVQGIHRILQVSDFFSRKAVRQYGLSGPQLWALRTIRDEECTSLKDLARRIHLPPATVRGLVELLEERGLAVLRREPDEERAVELRLTTSGRRLLSQAPEPPRSKISRGVKGLSAQELSCVHRAIEILSRILDLPRVFDDGGRGG